jgi:hypothetical protein
MEKKENSNRTHAVPDDAVIVRVRMAASMARRRSGIVPKVYPGFHSHAGAF